MCFIDEFSIILQICFSGADFSRLADITKGILKCDLSISSSVGCRRGGGGGMIALWSIAVRLRTSDVWCSRMTQCDSWSL